MKLSTRGRYAVMAMSDIAQVSRGEPISLGDISARQRISQAFLEQLFAQLRKSALVSSARGPGGGYKLARHPDDICIADIVTAVDEPLQVTRCQGDALDGCVDGDKCITHELWAALGRQVYGFLASVTLGDVVEGRNLALAASVKRAKSPPVRTLA